MSSSDVRAASSTADAADADHVVVHVDLEDLPEEFLQLSTEVTAEDSFWSSTAGLNSG